LLLLIAARTKVSSEEDDTLTFAPIAKKFELLLQNFLKLLTAKVDYHLEPENAHYIWSYE
jgi:hypothetical protein